MKWICLCWKTENQKTANEKLGDSVGLPPSFSFNRVKLSFYLEIIS